MTISFRDSADEVAREQLQGFFVGWPTRPTPETHLRLMRSSDRVVLAIDDETGQVVGFVTALTDGVLSAYISFLEVLPSHQRRGIGRELVRRLLATLDGLYMVDVMCEVELQPFYRALGMVPATGMILRRYEAQSGTL
jgi:ribosomal protein S18 acetylase RimI-like enzyme